MSLVIVITACGATKFSNSGSTVNLQSVDDNGNEIVTEPGPDLDILIEQPEQAEAYSCGKKKITICHVPPGNAAAAHTLCISKCAVTAHLREHARDNHSDYLGACVGESADDATDDGKDDDDQAAD